MRQPRMVVRPAFDVIGRKTWISGQDSAQFGRFWGQCHADGTIKRLVALCEGRPGAQTGGVLLGLSCVEADPQDRAFFFLIGVEWPTTDAPDSLEVHRVPATTWAVFPCRGPMPGALVASEMYAFGEWLPASGYVHAAAPEMEVYPPGEEDYCEFWLPVEEGA